MTTPTPVPTVTFMPTVTYAPTLEPTVSLTLDAVTQLSLTGLAVIVLAIALKLTLKMARDELVSQIDSLRKDPFRKPDIGQNWSWDYVFVFPVLDELADAATKGEANKFKRDNTLKKVITKLVKGGLDTTCFFSRDRSLIFVKVRASKDRLQREADRIDYKLLLDEREVQARMGDGEKNEDGSWRWFPRVYNEGIRSALEDGVYQEANYFRGSTLRERYEYVTLRSEDQEHAGLTEFDKPEVGTVFPIQDVMQQSTIPWYKFIYGKYDQDEDMQALYKIDPRTGCQFRGVDRLKLMRTIFEARPIDSGCGLDTGKMIEQKCVVGIFPLHNENDLIAMERGFMEFATLPWKHNIEDLKDYFGEKIGLYFTYLTHYTSWLLYSCLIGLATYILMIKIQMDRSESDDQEVRQTMNDPDVVLIPYYCVVMAFWATLYLEDWKRKQIETAMKWGTVGCESTETDRPEFLANPENIEINSPVNGELTMYFPPNVKRNRTYLSICIIALCILGVIVAVLGVFVFKALATSALWEETIAIPGMSFAGIEIPPFPLGGILASVANSVNILVASALYTTLADWMNDNENHRTDTEYEDALILKTFMFQFCNSYGALSYIAFIKEPILFSMFGPGDDYMDVKDVNGTRIYDDAETWEADLSEGEVIGYNSQCNPSCMGELSGQLFAIFVTRVIIANFKEVIVPYLKVSKSRAADTSEEFSEYENPEDPYGAKKRMRSLVEIEFDKEEYDELKGPFADYAEMAIQFGYGTLFVAAYPLAPLMAFVNNYVEIRVDLWKLGQNSRRPVPNNAEDIGNWQSILETMSTMAVISNSAMVCFTGTFLNDYKIWERFMLFLTMEHGLIILKDAIAMAVPDVPDHVQIQLDRNEFVCDKLIDHIEDEEDEAEEEDALRDEAVIMPNSTDEDVVLVAHRLEWQRAEDRMRAQKEGHEETKNEK